MDIHDKTKDQLIKELLQLRHEIDLLNTSKEKLAVELIIANKELAFISRAVESTSDVIGITDKQGRHFYQNKAFSDLFGYETAEETEAAGGGMARVKDKGIAKQMV